MKSAVIVARGNAGHQHSFGGAFAEGLRKHGWNATIQPDDSPCDLLVLWGVRKQDYVRRQKANGGEVCILERGYIGDRFSYSSVSFGGGLNGRAEFRGDLSNPSRFNRLFPDLMKPWRDNPEGYALIIGQVPGDMSLANVNIEAWYQQTYKALQHYGWSDIRFRSHPKSGSRPVYATGLKRLEGSLQEALDGAAVVITYNSNSGVDAALAGVPVVAMDRGSMAWDVSGHDITEIVTPERDAWASALANKQWTKEEMASGECWGFISDSR